ncbi:MAG: hypothetical protein AAF529_18555 [Pseudomonadota bacterium]
MQTRKSLPTLWRLTLLGLGISTALAFSDEQRPVNLAERMQHDSLAPILSPADPVPAAPQLDSVASSTSIPGD